MHLRNFDEIMERFPKKRVLSNHAVNKLPDDLVNSMQHLVGNDLSCDCRFENDDGSYLYSERGDADEFVLIATSGQGDEWLLRLSDGNICFLDHDNWEKADAISSMKISFRQFVSMADLLGQFEDETFAEDSITKAKIEALKSQFYTIHPMLVDLYPFDFV